MASNRSDFTNTTLSLNGININFRRITKIKEKDLFLGQNVDEHLYQTLKNLVIIGDSGREKDILDLCNFYRESSAEERKKRKSIESIHKLVVEQNNERVNRLEQEVLRLKNEKEALSIDTKPVPKDCLLAQRKTFEAEISKLKETIKSLENDKNAVSSDKNAFLAEKTLQKRKIDELSADLSAQKQAELKMAESAKKQLDVFKKMYRDQKIKNAELVQGYSHALADLSRLETFSKFDPETERGVELFFDAQIARLAEEKNFLAKNRLVQTRSGYSRMMQNIKNMKSQLAAMKRILENKIDSECKDATLIINKLETDNQQLKSQLNTAKQKMDHEISKIKTEFERSKSSLDEKYTRCIKRHISLTAEHNKTLDRLSVLELGVDEAGGFEKRLSELRENWAVFIVCTSCGPAVRFDFSAYFSNLPLNPNLEHPKTPCPSCHTNLLNAVAKPRPKAANPKKSKKSPQKEPKPPKKRLKKLFDPPDEDEAPGARFGPPLRFIARPLPPAAGASAADSSAPADEPAIKVEGVRLYSEKYRSVALANLEPFPQTEYEELREKLLSGRSTHFSRETRSGNSYSTSTHKSVVLNRRQHPALRRRIDKLLRRPVENRAAVLAYLRAFVKWYTNADHDPEPWIKPAEASPLEQINLAAADSERRVAVQDLTEDVAELSRRDYF